VAKAKLDEEKRSLAEAKEKGWEPLAGFVKTDSAISAYRECLKLCVGIKESTRQFYEWSLGAVLDIRHITEGRCIPQWAFSTSPRSH